MKALIEGFIKFQKEVFPQRSDLFKYLATTQNPETLFHPSVRLALEQKKLNLHGWVYDIETGSIIALDGKTNTFVSLAEFPETKA
ncbi:MULTISPECIES: hypothetical protein [unclassified Pseudomonas]|uniref:Carbonic anhydrase n=1 Tax=Pseudomonas sp. MYb327 TaxID=2745230 RepID=A0AAU8EAH0_9PSED